MAISAENIYQQYLDDAGVPLASGTLEFREAGTSTKKAIYTTVTATDEQSNPYTLDASGRTIGDVWLTEDGYYDILVKDSAGATVRTISNVGVPSGSSSETVADAQNRILNPSMVVQNGSSGNVTTTLTEFTVNDWLLKATNIGTAGTASGSESNLVGNSGYVLQVTTLSTNAGGTVVAAQNIASKNVESLANTTGDCTFACRVYHDAGVSLNYTIYVYTADAKDNFSAVTLRSTSTATSVSSATDTQVTHTVDLSTLTNADNGVQFWIECACGSVSSKNFYFNEAQLNYGSSAASFSYPVFEAETAAVGFANHDHEDFGSQIDTNGLVNGAVTQGKIEDNAVAPGKTNFMNNVIDFYAVELSATGSKNHGPSGWTTARDTNPGVYNVVHGLGTSNYTVSVIGAGSAFACNFAIGNSNFTYDMRNTDEASPANVNMTTYVQVFVHNGG